MTKSKYAIFDALNPFFEIVQEGLTGLVDGKHFFDTIADDAFFDFRYNFPGWPLTIRGRADLMDQFSGYGNTIKLHSADGLVVHRSQDSRIVILEYDVHGKILSTGVSYDNRLISVITIEQKNRALERLHGLSCRVDGVERQHSSSHNLSRINPIRAAQPRVYFASNRDRALFTCSQFVATQSTKPCIGRSRLFPRLVSSYSTRGGISGNKSLVIKPSRSKLRRVSVSIR